MRSQVFCCVTDPTLHAKMKGGVDIAQKSVQSFITIGRPFSDVACQMTNSTE